MQVNGMPITVGVGNVISEGGFSLLISPAVAGSVWKTLGSLGAVPMGSAAWEKLRIFQGAHLSNLNLFLLLGVLVRYYFMHLKF